LLTRNSEKNGSLPDFQAKSLLAAELAAQARLPLISEFRVSNPVSKSSYRVRSEVWGQAATFVPS